MLPKKTLKRIVDKDLELEYENALILQRNLAEARNNIVSSLYNKSEDNFNIKLKSVLDEYLDPLSEKIGEEFPMSNTYEHGIKQGKEILSHSADIPTNSEFHGWVPVLPINAISQEKARMADLIKEVSEDTKKELLRKSQVALAEGATTQELIEKLLGTGLKGLQGRDGVFRKATQRAETIGRSITNEVINKGALTTYQEVNNKSPELGLVKIWQAVSDRRTSDICKTLNGREVEIDEFFSASGFSGSTPPAHPNCRSRITTRPRKKWKEKEQKDKYPRNEETQNKTLSKTLPQGIPKDKIEKFRQLWNRKNNKNLTFEEFLERSQLNEQKVNELISNGNSRQKVINNLNNNIDSKINKIEDELNNDPVTRYKNKLESNNKNARDLREKIAKQKQDKVAKHTLVDMRKGEKNKVDGDLIQSNLDQLDERQKNIVNYFINKTDVKSFLTSFTTDDENGFNQYVDDLVGSLDLSIKHRKGLRNAIKKDKNVEMGWTKVLAPFKDPSDRKRTNSNGYTLPWDLDNLIMLNDDKFPSNLKVANVKKLRSSMDKEAKEHHAKGKNKPFSVAGQERNSSEKFFNTFIHELGHQVHFRSRKKYDNLRNVDLAEMGESEAVSRYGDSDKEGETDEFHAELFAMWVTSPESLKRERPALFHHIENLIADSIEELERNGSKLKR